MIKQAIILSAGLGTRLRPITDNIPKVMVPLAGKPLLEHHILQFKKHGVSEFFINLHYLPDAITNYFGDGSKWGVKITYRLEEKILGTAGGIKGFSAEGACPSVRRGSSSGGERQLDDEFFVVYGDMFSLVDYSKMREAFEKKPADAIGMMVVGENDHPQDSDLVEVNNELRFLKVHSKPHKELPKKWKSLDAVYIFRRGILKYIPADAYYEIDHQLLPDIVRCGEQFYGYETSDYLLDIGTIERYRQVEEYLKKNPA